MDRRYVALTTAVRSAVTMGACLALSACNWWWSSNDDGDGGATVITYYTVGGTVSGLNGAVVLAGTGAGNSNVRITGNGNFTLPTSLSTGTAYTVTIVTQPANQTCTVANGSGTANARVTNVAVSCASPTVTIGGTVSGLSGTLVLRNNGGNDLTVVANGAFTFSSAINGGTTYAVTVFSNPATQSCTVANGSGTANNNVTNVSVTCITTAPATVTIGGTVSGLTGTVVLQNNGGDNLSVSSAGAFVFATPITFGTGYAVTVLSQPAGQTCSVSNGSGTGNANVTNVTVSCGTGVTWNGTISGLTANGMVLRLNGANDTMIDAGIVGFSVFNMPLVTGDFYRVSIATQPTGLTCTIVRGVGFVPTTNIIDAQIDCVPLTPDVLVGTYTVAVNGTALRGFFTFFDIGTYFYGTHDAATAACSGLEYGAYSFNASAQTLTFPNAVIDHNADCGVHTDVAGASPAFISGTGVSKNAVTKVITGTFTNAGRPGTSVLTFTPVASTTEQLLGAWTGTGRGVVWVYNGDGTGFTATPFDVQNSPDPQPAGIDDACLTGVVPAASSGNYLAAFDVGCVIPGPSGASLSAVSTNGLAGFGNASYSPSTAYVVTGDTLTLTITTNTSSNVATYQRIVPN